MFRCDSCGGTSSKGQSPVFIVVEGRRREYRAWAPPQPPGRRGPPRRTRGDAGGKGWEIVREMRVCRHCGTKLADQPVEMSQLSPVAPIETTDAPEHPVQSVDSRLG